MPTIFTHALIPLAGAVAVSPRPAPWRLVAVAMAAAAAPDLDVVGQHVFAVHPGTTFSHRGASHSLFTAFAAGLLAAIFHRALRVSAPAAALAVGLAWASHGLLDSMTDNGQGVTLLWPLNDWRIIADWRPIHASPIDYRRFLVTNWNRIAGSEGRYVLAPALALAVVVRLILRPAAGKRRS